MTDLEDRILGRLGASAQASNETAAPSLNLPEQFWSARPVLEDLRRAARSAMVPCDAFLCAVLARRAATLPHTLELPAVRGAPVGLSLIVGLAGPPGTGKSSSARVAQQAVPAADGVPDLLPVGTGEGLLEVLYEWIEVPKESGRGTRRERLQTRHGAIVHVDEGEVLQDLAARKGSTLMPIMRSIFTGGTIGNANASSERNRVVQAGNYVYGITIAIQPELAGPLLGDAAAGTPQRVLWTYTIDPGITDKVLEWPRLGTLRPSDDTVNSIAVQRNLQLRHPLRIDSAVTAGIRARAAAVATGQVVLDEMDAHRDLLTLKVAALLALIDRRVHITEADWVLADVMYETSANVRRWLQEEVAAASRRADDQRTHAQARRDARLDTAAQDRAMDSCVKTMTTLLGKQPRSGPGLTEPELWRQCAHKYRMLIDRPTLFAQLAQQPGIETRDGKWFATR